MIKNIRKACLADLDRLMEIFQIAREYMVQTGNPHQWINGYPQKEMIAQEIQDEHCFVCTDEKDAVIATFCFIAGPDPTYSLIEEGEWPSDQPYHVIHRLASDGSCKHIAKSCIDWCLTQDKCLRADTHEDNKIMQHLLLSNGFKKCGIIYVANGTKRIAFQKG